ncbi:MAG: GNAT family N-acetyltransferase, partial [Bacteroidales bacterium]|nr:GNAT family N-acetyltransferase [Bacteroidales bacterium]
MNVRIEEIKDDFPYDLLLIADEAIEAIDKYLYDSD